jgi:hypothetical protein
MSAQDMRDMLGLTGDAARPPPLKKQKTVEKRQRASHLSVPNAPPANKMQSRKESLVRFQL